MVNLVFFFEMIDNYDDIEADFDFYLYDLLGIATDATAKYYPQSTAMAHPITFFRLLNAILKIEPHKADVDFRLLLTNIMQGLIRQKLEYAMKNRLKPELIDLMMQDLNRVSMWTKLCEGESREDFNTPAKRTIFNPMKSRIYPG